MKMYVKFKTIAKQLCLDKGYIPPSQQPIKLFPVPINNLSKMGSFPVKHDGLYFYINVNADKGTVTR